MKLLHISPYLLIPLCLIPFARSVFPRQESIAQPTEKVMVPGGGFSAFWFTFGRLQNEEKPSNSTYYCYSAGCLGVVAMKSGYTVGELIDKAFATRQRMYNGETKQTQITTDFVDMLIPQRGDSRRKDLIKALPQIRIITATTNGWFHIRPSVRRPETLGDLREMLIATTWIPYVTGSGFAHVDPQTGQRHLDGCVLPSVLQPEYDTYIGTPFRWDIMRYALDPTLSAEKARQFWMEGAMYSNSISK